MALSTKTASELDVALGDPGGGKEIRDILNGTDAGNRTIAGTLTVTGATTLSSTLAVTGAATLSSTLATAGAITGTSTSASALAVGPAGATNPTLQVDASTASAATGLKIKSAAAASGLALSVVTSGTDEALTINAAGAGAIGIGSVSTGAVTITPATTVVGAITPTGGIVYGARSIQLSRIKTGTTAGVVVNGATNIGSLGTVAQSQTNSTAVVYVDGLNVGDIITGFTIVSSINSGGNTVTIDANLRSMTVAAGAAATDASISSLTQVSVTGATASTATKSGLSTTIVSGVRYYLLLTVTTGASCTIELDQVQVTYTPNAAQ